MPFCLKYCSIWKAVSFKFNATEMEYETTETSLYERTVTKTE